MEYKERDLINSLEVNKDTMFLIGAGCSILSGCMPASKLVAEFKRRIYCVENRIKYDDVRQDFNDEFDQKMNDFFGKDNIDNPYAYYFEKCFPFPDDRNLFIKNNFKNINPSLGYLCFAHYLMSKKIKYVLTTNFDDLVYKSIKKLNINYDIGESSDSLELKQECDLKLIKLHGDYNYDLLKNTKDELRKLSEQMTGELLKINVRRIIVIGYSGSDKSVMDFLEQYAKLNKDTEIIWCIIEDSDKRLVIDNVLSLNKNSKYCKISGFDDLFLNLYRTYYQNNSIIDETINHFKLSNFRLDSEDYSQTICMNFIKIKETPNIYLITKKHNTNIKEINDNNSDVFIVDYKSINYCIGDKTTLSNLLDVDEEDVETISLDSCKELPLFLKCRLIKELLFRNLEDCGISRCRDNVYIDDGQKIKTGLKIKIALFNNDFVLICEPNYFVDGEINENLKSLINNKKSYLYSKQNFELRRSLFKNIIKNEIIIFREHKIKLDLNDYIISNDNKNCKTGLSSEPLMRTGDNKSANQILLLNNYGPINHIFTTDKIKVGIFCVNKDLNKLQNYLNKVIYGTNSYSCENKSIVPKFSGFKSVFRKDIEFLRNSIPQFSFSGIVKEINKGRSLDQIIYNAISKYYQQNQMDIILIYLGNNFDIYKKEGDYDLHDKLKLLCLNKYKTQFLEESSIDSSEPIDKRIYNLALGIYTKAIGIPRYPIEYEKNTIYIGMSFGISNNGVCIGCSQIFDAKGRGMQLIVSKVTNKFKKNQFLNKDEAYELGKKIRTTYYKSNQVEEIKRIVIHRVSPFKNEEIQGFKMAFNGINDFDLIEITDASMFNAYKIVNNQCYNFPLKRGTIVKISNHKSLLWLDGSIQEKDIDNGRNYRNNKRGMGRPIIIKKAYGTQSLNEVADALMLLSKMDFNSGDIVYSKLPVTIKYSGIVCDLLKQGDIADDLISFEYIM